MRYFSGVLGSGAAGRKLSLQAFAVYGVTAELRVPTHKGEVPGLRVV